MPMIKNNLEGIVKGSKLKSYGLGLIISVLGLNCIYEYRELPSQNFVEVNMQEISFEINYEENKKGGMDIYETNPCLDKYFMDNDEDGYGDSYVWICEQLTGYVKDHSDCDDYNSGVHPGAGEVCDKVDNNCNGQTDEGLMKECSSVCGKGVENCINGVWGSCNAPTVQYEEQFCKNATVYWKDKCGNISLLENCKSNEKCINGSCVCQPDCTNKICGDDGCGGSCGSCANTKLGNKQECVKGNCKCVPNCEGKLCGDDGCGGNCGNCIKGNICDVNDYQCKPTCGGEICKKGEKCCGDAEEGMGLCVKENEVCCDFPDYWKKCIGSCDSDYKCNPAPDSALYKSYWCVPKEKVICPEYGSVPFYCKNADDICTQAYGLSYCCPNDKPSVFAFSNYSPPPSEYCCPDKSAPAKEECVSPKQTEYPFEAMKKKCGEK